ncbi:hypothetical protein [Planktosalinus lacus]|uniref:Uncharacterized protein n=1 Tax=Planktosalinus lacus TaxID=1526573 RepID=A0A8J2V9V3_9FLAO|nr:hypothetical protein [Planktosalinus lacus]GGD90577.1 hypothetical protein GCM10011312_13120 [Planktosalinus lacus]
MKTFKNVLILCTFLFTAGAFAQQNYTVNGNTYSLKTEVEGPITLLWNVIDNEYRYFAKKGNEIIELKNTRINGKYQEEYKATLRQLTTDHPVDPSKTNITLPGLRAYINQYNTLADPNFEEKTTQFELETRLGVFAGISNNTSTTNPENVFAPLAGLEFEITDNVVLKRHSIVLQFRHSFKADEYDLTFSQIALNYRFKFIYSEKIAVFAQAKLFTLTFSTLDENNAEGLEDLKNTSLNAPLGLGLGMDYKLGNGYLTLGVNDLVSPGIDANDEFSMDVTLGYKFSL